MAIVTISHEMGSGGAELGMALASHLSYRHVDHDVILDRARTYGLAEDRLAHLEEDKPSLFERFDTETRRYIMVIQTDNGSCEAFPTCCESGSSPPSSSASND